MLHDRVAIWEVHYRYEFEPRDVAATMATMVAAPYVFHVPMMTGGVGHCALKRFDKYHFIGGNPVDTVLTQVAAPAKSTGCCPASRRPAAGSRCRWSRS